MKYFIFFLMIPLITFAESEVNQNNLLNSVVFLKKEKTYLEFLVWTTIDKINYKKETINKVCEDLKLECKIESTKSKSLVKMNISAKGKEDNINTLVLSLK